MPSPNPDDPPPVSRAEFDALREQVHALADATRATTPADAADPPAEDEVFWALEGLRARLDDAAGGVLFTGSVELRPDVPHRWQLAATTAGLLATDWAELGPTIDALGHPVRLHLLQLIATGTTRTADLAEAEGIGTSGQVHHHLRQLVAAGWLRSAGRGSYEVPPNRVVPLLVLVLAAQR